MPTGMTQGIAYVELAALTRYLSEQYAGMGGGDIANHRYFCRKVPGRLTLLWGAKGGPHPSSGVATVLVPKANIAAYLRAQYSNRMNGAAIAGHKWFLRSVPVVYIQ